MSLNERLAPRRGRAHVAVIASAVVLGGVAAVFFGSQAPRPEGGLADSRGAARLAFVSAPDEAASVTLEPVADHMLEGCPVLLRLRGFDAQGKAAAGTRPPRALSLVLAGAPTVHLTVTGGFELKGDRMTPDSAVRFDAKGELLIGLRSAEVAGANLRAEIAGRQVASVPVEWLPAPNDFVVLLNGQRLEAGRVAGEPATIRPGEELSIELVPLRDGAETRFFGTCQATLSIDGGEATVAYVRGERAHVSMKTPTTLRDGAVVEVRGLGAGKNHKSSAVRIANVATRNG